MAPVVDGLAKEYEGKVAVRMYNVDSNVRGRELARGYGVQYVPTFVLVDSGGRVADTIVGEASADTLRKAMDKLK